MAEEEATKAMQEHNATQSPPHRRPQGSDDKNKAAAVSRHPRWTRQETFILIQGKKVIENGGFGRARRRGSPTGALGSDQPEPKWDSVSSYCRQHGVNRAPFQCRKRWGNLIGDFNKIRAWEAQAEDGRDSFWSTRSDLRKERRLPASFDRAVYNALDGKEFNVGVLPLAVFSGSADVKNEDDEAKNGDDGTKDGDEDMGEEDQEEEEAAENGLFSDFEQNGQEETSGSPKVKRERESPMKPAGSVQSPISGRTKQEQPDSNACMGSTSQDGQKRRRKSVNGSGDANTEEKLKKVLERIGDMLSEHFEAQNINCQLDREKWEDQATSLVATLEKLVNVLEKLAGGLEKLSGGLEKLGTIGHGKQ